MNNNLRMMLGYLGFLPFGFLAVLPWRRVYLSILLLINSLWSNHFVILSWNELGLEYF